jgi:hypothetical protein
MNRNELTRMFVLNEIGDDYENLEKIAKEVTALGTRCGLTLDLPEISNALMYLMEAGLARAYRLSPTRPNEEIQVVPPQEQLPDLYFLATAKGAGEHQRLEQYWPFDDEGSLRQDWTLSQA